MTWLLRLYPRAWRARYEEEMRQVLAGEAPTLRLAVDLLAGAVDAHVNPHWTPGREPSPRAIGGPMISKIVACEVRSMKKMAAGRQAAWLIGASSTLAGVAVTLTALFGRTSFSEALIYAAFPMALMCSSECGYLGRYSATARWVLIGAGNALILGIMWGAVALGDRI